MKPLVMRRNVIEPLQTELRHSDIGTGNGHKKFTPNLGRAPCAEWSGKMRRGAGRLAYRACRCYFHLNYVTSTRLQADSLHSLVNWRCRFCNSRPDLVPSQPGDESRLNEQYQGPMMEQLVILQWNAFKILRNVAAL